MPVGDNVNKISLGELFSMWWQWVSSMNMCMALLVFDRVIAFSCYENIYVARHLDLQTSYQSIPTPAHRMLCNLGSCAIIL